MCDFLNNLKSETISTINEHVSFTLTDSGVLGSKLLIPKKLPEKTLLLPPSNPQEYVCSSLQGKGLYFIFTQICGNIFTRKKEKVLCW